MCIICYAPKGVMPTDQQVINCNSNNPDGFGWAIRTPNGITIGKTMSSTDAVDEFLTIREQFIDFDAVYHARITTHGKTMLDNNHPFIIGKDKRNVLVHNGMLPITVAKGDDRSDTRIFAEHTLPSMGLGVLDKSKSKKKLEQWMKGSKMVILSDSPKTKKDTYILNENDGIWDNGLWFSNHSYSYSSRYTYSNHPTLDLGIECMNPECGIVWDSDSEAAYSGICERCYACVDCGDDILACLCYDAEIESHLATNKVRW